jgi:hypothetical protein
MAGQGSLEPYIEVRVLAPEPAGPLAQWQSGRLITGWSQVRILQGPLDMGLSQQVGGMETALVEHIRLIAVCTVT